MSPGIVRTIVDELHLAGKNTVFFGFLIVQLREIAVCRIKGQTDSVIFDRMLRDSKYLVCLYLVCLSAIDPVGAITERGQFCVYDVVVFVATVCHVAADFLIWYRMLTVFVLVGDSGTSVWLADSDRYTNRTGKRIEYDHRSTAIVCFPEVPVFLL